MKQYALSDEQQDIVFHNSCEGPILVEASAGSGKTRILTERVRYLLTEHRDKFFSVLCLTFTNKAAEEMKERLLGTPKLDERAYIGNFHEFCLVKILSTRFGEIGLSKLPHIFTEDDQKKILEEVIYGNEKLNNIYKSKDSKSQRELLGKCLDFISEAKRKLTVIPEYETNWKNWGEENTFLFQDYNRRLINQNAMDYDDILLYAFRILNERPVTARLYQRNYRYIMIDEAQDLNYAQYQIIRTICGNEHRNVMMVGDPKQAIYGFNGSSPKYMQEYFVKDFGAEKKEIRYNYRSSQKVLELAQQIQPNGGIGFNYFKGISSLITFENELSEAEWIVSKIKEWYTKGQYQEQHKGVEERITLKDIAVLARNKFVFKTLIEQLDADPELKGKYYLRKGIERFEPESILVKSFDLGLRILVNPLDVLHFRQLVNELKITGVEEQGDRLGILLSLNEYPSGELDVETIGMLVEIWQKLNTNPKWLGDAIRSLMQRLQDKTITLPESEALKAVFDLTEMERFWGFFVRKEASENRNITNFRYFIALNGSKENKEELVLATVHTTKGLEFPIVFLMGMCEGIFPDYRARNETQLKEERNNVYVAVTRAKRAIYITYPQSRVMPWGDTKHQQISRFIRDIELL